jgi:O-methyltransferase involved in polyketide biosynthesis
LPRTVAVAGLAEGRVDYVILGAGLDTCAWRHPRASGFTVREIDLPGTQEILRAIAATSDEAVLVGEFPLSPE